MSTILDIQKVTSKHNTSVRSKPIEYIVVHYTAGATSVKGKAVDNALYYAQTTEKASADFFIDDATIVQYNPCPEERYCWAVGGKQADTSQGGGKFWKIAGNGNCINVEMCSTNTTGKPGNPNDPTYMFTSGVMKNAANLVKYLMCEFDIPIGNVIRHFDVTGKLCPGVIGWNEASGDSLKWKTFKTLCTVPSVPNERFDAIYQMPIWAKPTIKKLCDMGYLRGNETVYDINGRPADLDLSMDMIRMMVIEDRAGLYGGVV